MPLLYIVFSVLVLLISAIIHEYAHGWMADQLGDPTARYAGRLTLNPKAHIDPFGSIILPLMMLLPSLISSTIPRFIFAYAKPVPYNPYNLKDQKWGPVWVGLAGPAANLLLASAFAIVLRFMPFTGMNDLLAIIIYNNVMLMVFNLVPIPPLDGSKLLFAVLPYSMQNVRIFLERYGFMILLFFMVFMFKFIAPVINSLFYLLVGF